MMFAVHVLRTGHCLVVTMVTGQPRGAKAYNTRSVGCRAGNCWP